MRLETTPTVSVLLPAWNEAEGISRSIESLMAAKCPNLEIIICAGGSDGTEAVARSYERRWPDLIKVIPQAPGDGKQVALRNAFRHARGEIIYLTDADCVIPRATLQTLIAAVSAGEADAVTGPANPLSDQRDSPWIRHQWAAIHAVDRERARVSSGLLGRNCAVRRDAIDEAGGFAEVVKTGTDFHLARKLLAAGRTIHYLPVAVETTYHEGFSAYCRQQSRWMRNVLIHGRRFGAQSEDLQVMRSMALGIALLTWPLTWRWTRLPGIIAWMMPILWMSHVRIKQQEQLEKDFQLEPGTGTVPRSVLYSLADLVVWARPALDMLIPARRSRW